MNGREKGAAVMKRMVIPVFLFLVLWTGIAQAQFKSQIEEPRASGSIIHDSSPFFLFGWFNPDAFHMRHSVTLSYTTIGGQGMSLGTYTNSMRYDFADNLNARADVSLSYSPYNSFSTFGQNDLSSVYLSRAEINYKPWENMSVRVGYRNSPYGFYSPFYYNPWYRPYGDDE